MIGVRTPPSVDSAEKPSRMVIRLRRVGLPVDAGTGEVAIRLPLWHGVTHNQSGYDIGNRQLRLWTNPSDSPSLPGRKTAMNRRSVAVIVHYRRVCGGDEVTFVTK